MNYVFHICKNKDCNNGWIDKDLTKVKTIPPKWKYCKECCKKFGIDFNKQKPSRRDNTNINQDIPDKD